MRGLMVWAALLLLALGGVRGAYWVGSRLPWEHRVRVSGVVAASPERVWEMLNEPLVYDQWRKGIGRIQTHDPLWSGGLVCWTEWRPLMPLAMCLAGKQEPGVRRVVTTHDWGPVSFNDWWPMPFTATWTYELAPVTGGTHVTITEESSIARPLWRFYGRYFLRGRTEVAQQMLDLQSEGPRRR